jgi:L-lactate dehydrogenase complex protein LldG
MSDTPRNNILNKIRMALDIPTPLPFPKSEGTNSLYQPPPPDLVVEFAEQFTHLQGKFIFCADLNELVQNFARLCYQNQWTKIFCSEEVLCNNLPVSQYHKDIASCDAAVTSCEALVARTGSMLLSSTANDRIPSVYAPIHICIAFTSQLVYDIKDALLFIKEKYRDKFPSLITLASGPSRTADIEKTLVVGVHGPKEVYCFLLDDSHIA